MSRISFIDFAPDGEGAGEGAGGAEGLGTEGTPGAGTDGASGFTQADVDRIVQERLARQKAQFKDYDDLKDKALKFEEFEASQKTELEKAAERAAKAEAELAAVNERAQRLVTDAAITAAATGKLADPTDALAMLDRSTVEYGEDGSPANVASLIDALVTAKPHLAAQAPRKVVDIDGGARGGGAHALDGDALMALPDGEFLKALGPAQ